jgi:hypothetical protein
MLSTKRQFFSIRQILASISEIKNTSVFYVINK